MGISLTTDQVLALAPDASSAAAGKKLANAKPWMNLGQNSEALWGECQGSALYQVKIDLSSMTIQCSCPSRKFPCKHSLGLLLLAVAIPSAAPISEPPEWVTAWLAKRQTQAASKQRETKETPATTKTNSGPSTSRATRAEKRRDLVAQGLERLDLWLSDLVRNGLASVESQPATFWEQQAAQMIDAQAPGIAARLRSMAGIPNSSSRWPEELLGQLGRLALLTEAYHQGERLEAALQEDVRRLIGWTLDQDEVAARGERITDDWLILGQVTGEEEDGSRGSKAGKQRVRMQRTWLLGTQTGRTALVLQFSAVGASFPEVYPLGTCQVADVLFWPGACPQRGRIEKRHGAWRAIQEPLPGATTVDAFFAGVATALARQPWLERFLCALQQVVPVCSNDRWYIRDNSGTALPLTRGSHWKLLALSGGAAVDCAGEWDGETLLPLGVLVDGTYHLL